jgi:hypothetical protein
VLKAKREQRNFPPTSESFHRLKLASNKAAGK